MDSHHRMPKGKSTVQTRLPPLALAPIGTGSTNQPPWPRSEAVELRDKNKLVFQVTSPRDPSDRYTLANVVRHSSSPCGCCELPTEKARPAPTPPRLTPRPRCYTNAYSRRYLTLHNSARSTRSRRLDCYPCPWISSNTHFEEPCHSQSDALSASR